MSNGKDVEAVEIVREVRDRHHELLKGKSPEERDRFYREQSAALHRKLGVRVKSRQACGHPADRRGHYDEHAKTLANGDLT